MPATDHLGGQFPRKRRITAGSIYTTWPGYGYGRNNDADTGDDGDADSGDESGDLGDGGGGEGE